MVFGNSKLQDQVFCLTEERDYFQTKFLEQVSEIAHLKDGLGRAKKEIDRLRKELMARGVEMDDEEDDDEEEAEAFRSIQVGLAASPLSPAAQSPRTPNKKEKKKKKNINNKANQDIEEDEKKDDTSELTAEEDDDEEDKDDDGDDKDEDNEANDIRQSAEKLLQWASYRSLTRSSLTPCSPEHLSVASPLSLNSSSMLQERSEARRLGRGIPSSVQLDAALSQPNGKGEKNQGSLDEDSDEKTLSSTVSSEVDHEHDSEQEVASSSDEPPRRGKKLFQKFENLVTSL